MQQQRALDYFAKSSRNSLSRLSAIHKIQQNQSSFTRFSPLFHGSPTHCSTPLHPFPVQSSPYLHSKSSLPIFYDFISARLVNQKSATIVTQVILGAQIRQRTASFLLYYLVLHVYKILHTIKVHMVAIKSL